jgi:hypothetical protein
MLLMNSSYKDLFISCTLNQNINKPDVLKSVFSMIGEMKCYSSFLSSATILFVVFHSETASLTREEQKLRVVEITNTIH